ncbi:coproporphyrinogen dehydrogenase HemZ [Chakrabartyella piscis]|uniref:coproporphyrinogen dehydrogenase HemZ n=1 Tax=Chakrabartyella piscis TaxID=2918914 RepID=UPI0029587AC8|nr:coproporphyrinogen dehydrogenase HemZ [Chakrabartyella piscis]
MISYQLKGHSLQNDVQTMVQVFYANEHYALVEDVATEGITVKSILENGTAEAVLFLDGTKQRAWSMEYLEPLTPKESRRLVKRTIYELLKAELRIRPQWGLLTGVRPAKIVSTLLADGASDAECFRYLTEDYLVMPNKAELTIKVAKAEQRILEGNSDGDLSLYIGIPFCPTRCIYCSFTAYPLKQYEKRVDEYLDAMCKELDFIGDYAKDFQMKNIYIGGGTPTSLNEVQLERLLKKIEELFDTSDMEYTVEAGRPDTITKEKLRLMKAYGVNRISINPQTMNEDTLKAIGRKHSVEDIKRVFHEARELGHENINMDLILGLPDETVEHVERTFAEIMKLQPDNVTVHTLAVKRASRLKEEFDQHQMTTAEILDKMLVVAEDYAKKLHMEPYYMYRQKNMVGNFENVGYCTVGKEGAYNIQIMEEKQTILAVGCGGSTKTYDAKTDKLERIFNVKGVEEYIARIDEMIDRKRIGLGGLK